MSIGYKPSLPKEMEIMKKSGGEVKTNYSGDAKDIYILNYTEQTLP